MIYQSIDIAATQVFLVVLLSIRCDVTLLIEVTQHNGLFGIFLDVNNHLIIITYRIVLTLSRILRHRNLREKLLNLLLNLIHVYITYHYDSLQVRTIPFMIVIAQVLIGEIVDDVHRADRHAVFILRTLIDLRHSQLHQSLHSTSGTTGAPLLMDNTTFLVYLCIFQQQVMTPVVQNEQTRVENAFTFQRNSRNIIYRLLYAGISIQVSTKLHTNGLAPGNDTQLLSLAREVLGTIKRHVFQEVRQATLTGFFLYRTHLLGDIEVCQSCLFGIMTQIICQAVLQLSCSNGGVL